MLWRVQCSRPCSRVVRNAHHGLTLDQSTRSSNHFKASLRPSAFNTTVVDWKSRCDILDILSGQSEIPDTCKA